MSFPWEATDGEDENKVIFPVPAHSHLALLWDYGPGDLGAVLRVQLFLFMPGEGSALYPSMLQLRADFSWVSALFTIHLLLFNIKFSILAAPEL